MKTIKQWLKSKDVEWDETYTIDGITEYSYGDGEITAISNKDYTGGYLEITITIINEAAGTKELFMGAADSNLVSDALLDMELLKEEG